MQPVIPLIDGERYRHQPDGRLLTPHTLELEQEIIQTRYELARDYAADNKLNHVTVDPSDAWIGLVASGITYREVREALGSVWVCAPTTRWLRWAFRLLKMGMPLPFNPGDHPRLRPRPAKRSFVIEEKQRQHGGR